MNKLFEETVAGRMRLARNISSAPSWVPKEGVQVKTSQIVNGTIMEDDANPYEGVPRPDKSISTLWWLSVIPFTSILGLDHFYLRSPWTGVAKLFTLGGFGLWWLWDALQVSFEKERVLDYGLSTPFDSVTGIAQGMIHDDHDKPSLYEQQTSYGMWFLATLFGFTGIDSIMLGRSWLGIRKLIIFVIMISVVVPMFTTGGWSFLGIIVLLIFNQEIIGLFASWGSDVYTLIAKTDSIMTTGMPVPKVAYDAFAWIKKLYVKSVETDGGMVDVPLSAELRPTWNTLQEHYMFKEGGISGDELRARFWIGRVGESASLPKQSNDPPGNPPITIAGRMIQIMGEWIVLAVKAIYYIFVPPAAVAGLVAEASMRATQMATEIAERKALEMAAKASRIQDLENLLPSGGIGGITKAAASGGIGGIVKAASGGIGGITKAAASGGIGGIVKAASGGIANAVPTLREMAGGAREEPLSTEAQIMGATVIALIAGGSLKGLVDYLMKE